MNKIEWVSYLNDYLKIADFQDTSANGLQVDSSKGEIKKIGYAVDSTSYIFERAKLEEVDMIIAHHGIFWGYEQILTWVPYKRAKILIENDIALYACHLPLDAHPEVGNNIGLLKGFCNIFWIPESQQKIESFGWYKWLDIWFWVRFQKPVHVSSLQTLFADTLWLQKKLYNFWEKQEITSICFVSGHGASATKEAFEKNYDILVTWEIVHYELTFAKELGQSIFVWGHYETEKIWPKLLAHHVQEKFGCEVVFLDEKY